MGAIFEVLAEQTFRTFGDRFVERAGDRILATGRPDSAFCRLLTQWSAADSRPRVLLVDGLDALVGDTLLSVLRQLCSGYDQRPGNYPHSMILCGVLDIPDYRIRSSSAGREIAGGSAFNVSAASLRLRDFSEAEISALLGQHTAQTGQAFLGDAIQRVWTQTRGQPWLVNALCNRVCARLATGAAERNRPISGDDILAAPEELILERAMHFKQLGDNLREDSVRRVIEPILAGASGGDFPNDDYDYVRDPGLIAPDPPLRIANPIYGEVVPREFTCALQHCRKYGGCSGSWASASCCGVAWNRRSREAWTRVRPMSTAAPQTRVTWSCSTATSPHPPQAVRSALTTRSDRD